MSRDAWMKRLHGFLNGNLESHPGKKLTAHLAGTTSKAEELAVQHGLEQFLPELDIACETHDIGKADNLFQKHLYGGRSVEHSAPSSFFTLLAAEDDRPMFETVFFAAEAVRRHHTYIEDWNTIGNFWSHENLIKEMNAKIKDLIPQCEREIDGDRFEEMNDALFDIDEDTPKQEYWFHLKLLLSLLAAGDRMDAINVQSASLAEVPPFRGKQFSIRNVMDEWRKSVFLQCSEAGKNVLSPGIFTLTLPTGAGKTNTGLNIAAAFADKFKYKTIIYAMPFISIVEQNADFAKEIFGAENVQEDHSLALFGNSGTQDENAPYDERAQQIRMRELFRYWNSPVVVTTLAHLWECIFNPKANASMNFHRLSRAVVVIDEPQSINSSCWRQFGKMLEFLNKKLGTIFILMTATQPAIGNYTELAPKTQMPVNRHKYKFIRGRHTLSDIADILHENVDYKSKSGMIILNTKKSAYEAYQIFSQQMDAPVYLLSRWMTPCHRRRVLREITAKQANRERCYLIATQVVEAGVDLDFDWVFRDLGPLDSIIQAAGRCNRSALKEEGRVIVAELVSEKGHAYSDYVYDKVIMEQTRFIFNKYEELSDSGISQIVAEYYALLSNAILASGVWENIVSGKWSSYQQLWENENIGEVPAYVDINGEADKLLTQLRSIEPTLKNRGELKKLRNNLEQYSIGVTNKEIGKWQNMLGLFVSQDEEMLECCDEYYLIRQAGIGKDKIYDETAGFQPVLGDEGSMDF